MYPGIFSLIREQHKRAVTGYFYEWEGMKYLYDKGSETKSLNAKGDALDKAVHEFIKKENPAFTFIAYEEPDGAGHKNGWTSEGYIEACKIIDRRICEVIETVRESRIGKEAVIFIVTDHGGKGTGHGGKTMEEMQPLFAVGGNGIKKNYIMKDSWMMFDIGATFAYFLKVKPHPAWRGRAMLEILED